MNKSPAAPIARAIAAAAMGLALLSACGNNSDVSCGLDECTVTFDRGVDASASILGVEAKMLSAEGDRVTMEVAGEEITLTVGQAATEVAGLQVYLDSVTADQIAVRISRW
jgi:hypothetical protein